MPYIKQVDRDIVDPQIEALQQQISTFDSSRVDGVMNYCLTRIATGVSAKNWRYVSIKDVVAAFECAKLEFYARVARPYEDKKIDQEGDVEEYRGI